MRGKEKIERAREIARILCEPKIGDRVRVLECTIAKHKSLRAPCYRLLDGMVGTERIITRTMMYAFPSCSFKTQIWLTKDLASPPTAWWLTRHQFEIIDG